MKNFILSLTFIAASFFAAQAQEALTSGAKIEFDKEVHDYGKIDYDGDPFCEFKFKNTGTQPLIISKAKGSCGCTVPTWPQEPIAPGATGVIKVKYDTKRPGAINKMVTINSNAGNVENGISILRIKGEVGPKPASGTPSNNSGAPSNN